MRTFKYRLTQRLSRKRRTRERSVRSFYLNRLLFSAFIVTKKNQNLNEDDIHFFYVYVYCIQNSYNFYCVMYVFRRWKVVQKQLTIISTCIHWILYIMKPGKKVIYSEHLVILPLVQFNNCIIYSICLFRGRTSYNSMQFSPEVARKRRHAMELCSIAQILLLYDNSNYDRTQISILLLSINYTR